jgi:AraC-like DNA-binding protein
VQEAREVLVKARQFFFQDFHIHGASAPEWNQRYLQTSPGVMRSSLSEWASEDVHVFRKWMSERVVQQGGLPHGQLCFALLGMDPSSTMRVQGQEFRAGDLLVLRGGEEFEFQRPAGVELLSVTFNELAFSEFLDEAQVPAATRRVIQRRVIRMGAAAHDALRRRIRAQLASQEVCSRQDVMDAVREALADATTAPAQRAASIAAARFVKSCQEIALAEPREQRLLIEELCRRLHTSRRTLQGSFNEVTGTSPLVYLRSLRLNSVRQRLLSSSAAEVSVSEAATEAGFDHFGHFATAYKALFGELPSRTRRLAARADRPRRRPAVGVA